MAAYVDVEVRITAKNETGVVEQYDPGPLRFLRGATQKQEVSLTGSAFTTITVPSGARAVLIEPGSATSLTIKGVTGDTGTTIVPSSNTPGLPIFLPLGSSPSLGILNGGSTATVRLWYF